ncbi:unnamed protein product [Angiostrongylus costaricensis]|uniref:Innexin n=1 Tax=Angiostrongylus costaricensis TaxID=334426 RepID=A0A0R3PF46_ANGCS|nr:unnamed protein product [Angiostrongylus costaricensis]
MNFFPNDQVIDGWPINGKEPVTQSNLRLDESVIFVLLLMRPVVGWLIATYPFCAPGRWFDTAAILRRQPCPDQAIDFACVRIGWNSGLRRSIVMIYPVHIDNCSIALSQNPLPVHRTSSLTMGAHVTVSLFHNYFAITEYFDTADFISIRIVQLFVLVFGEAETSDIVK